MREKKKRELVLTELHRDFFAYLSLVHVSRRDAIRSYLNTKLGYAITDAELRRIKADLIDLGYPIGSSTERGYFIIYPGDTKALTEACNEFRNKARTELRRSAKLKTNVYKFYYKPGEQLDLFRLPPERSSSK